MKGSAVHYHQELIPSAFRISLHPNAEIKTVCAVHHSHSNFDDPATDLYEDISQIGGERRSFQLFFSFDSLII